MTDGETSGLVGEVSLSVSLQVAEGVVAEEMESEEPEESGIVMRTRTRTQSTIRHCLRRRSTLTLPSTEHRNRIFGST